MLRLNQLKLPVGHTPEQLRKKIIRLLGIKDSALKEFSIRKRSLDARKKPDIYYVYTVDAAVEKEGHVLKQSKGRAQKVFPKQYRIPSHGTEKMNGGPVVAGSGPAGLFCALLLAKEGYKPVVIERGAPVNERKADVERFWETGVLDPSSNVQFGEGGAGTFSDGKLNTLTKDSEGRNRFVLETFVSFGAPEDILWEQKPHIGTDILIRVVEAMRRRIIELGGIFRFHSQITDILPSENMLVINGKEKIKTDAAVFAIGHSARDTFAMLYDRGVVMEAKSFAVGVRAEHLQEMIDCNTYGGPRRDGLPAASYKMAEKLENGRGVYTFCMCPGGYVVNASSEEGRLAVNGMSYHGRAGENANSAIIATVTPDDFHSAHPLAGIEFQRELEERAWRAGRGRVPVQRLEDFLQNRISEGFTKVQPNIKGGYTRANVREIFPEELAWSIGEGIRRMGKKIPGFDDADTVLSGVESRTSSPVRILRDAQFTANIPWIYPCGEGAGYAGGITSAAMDGMRTAEAVIRRFCPEFTEN